LIRVTGGALEKDKSYWYLIDYERRQGKWCYKSPGSLPGELLLYNDKSQQKEAIPRLSAHTAKKALGIVARPDRKMFDEVKHLRKLSYPQIICPHCQKSIGHCGTTG
jgi:hypothetical protein